MNKKVAAAIAIIAAIGSVGGGSFITYQNTVTNISSDDDTTIINNENILNLDELKEDIVRTGIDVVCEEDPTLEICR